MTLSIEEVLNWLNNFFVYTYAPNVYVDFDADAGTITLADSGKVLTDYALDVRVNQYIRIEGSRLNDGVHKVSAKGDTSVTVDSTLIDEESDSNLDYVTIYGLAIPQKLLSIITEMADWSGTSNVKSETLGPHSITYDRPVTVFNSFESRLKKYKKVGWR